MARTKTKTNPHQQYEDALRHKQQQLLDSYERDKAAGNAQPDDTGDEQEVTVLGSAPDSARARGGTGPPRALPTTNYELPTLFLKRSPARRHPCPARWTG